MSPLLQMGDAESAEVDSTAAIGLDATYIKAYQRRAAARQMQGRQLEARNWPSISQRFIVQCTVALSSCWA